MSRYTEAYSGLVGRLPEVETLYKLANRHLVSVGPLTGARVSNPLCRAGVVLLSSHIEGYIEDLSEVILRSIYENNASKKDLGSRFPYYFSRDLIGEIGDTRDPDKISEKIYTLFERDKHIWCSREKFSKELPADRFASGFSTPRFDEISRFVARFGYSDYRRDLGRNLQGNFQPCIRMVDNVVDQRNKIAHGDTVTTATPTDLQDMVRLVRIFCRSTDEVVGNWFKTIGCPIRQSSDRFHHRMS